MEEKTSSEAEKLEKLRQEIAELRQEISKKESKKRKILKWIGNKVIIVVILSMICGILNYFIVVPSVAKLISLPQVEIIAAQFSIPADSGQDHLNEWVTIKNKESGSIDMSGWKLVDEGENFVYIFSEGFNLQANATVTIHTSHGTNTSADLYMNRNLAIWNDDGDTATLQDDRGKTIDEWCSR